MALFGLLVDWVWWVLAILLWVLAVLLLARS